MSVPPGAAQVIIVGGGPVGMGLAIELGQRHVRCIVVERYARPQPIPKGQNLTQRTLEHFHFWGVEKEVRAARTIPPEYGIGGLTAYGTLLGSYSYDWMQRELVRPFYFTDNERLPQYATEGVLRRRAAELATVETLYGWSAEDVSQDDHGATVVITEHDGKDRRTLRADYVVGCDGSRSTTRVQGGITQTLSDHDRLMVLLVFRSHGLHRLLERFPGKSFYSILHPDLEGYWKFFGRVDLGSTWFFHAPVPPGTTKDNFDFRQHLHAAAGAEFDVEFEHIGFWDLRFAIADAYRRGRIFIAGDAAHSHPPYGGYGVNTGLEDARNLGWKLAAVLQGWAGKASSTPTARSGGRCSSRPRETSSRRPSTPIASSWRNSIRSATKMRSSANGGCANRAHAPRSTLSSRTTRAPQSCREPPEATAALSARMPSPPGLDIIWHPSRSPRAATCSKSWGTAGRYSAWPATTPFAAHSRRPRSRCASP